MAATDDQITRLDQYPRSCVGGASRESGNEAGGCVMVKVERIEEVAENDQLPPSRGQPLDERIPRLGFASKQVDLVLHGWWGCDDWRRRLGRGLSPAL